ncbi:hypothetical protein JHK82_033760 [Glycine max]|nr:hypothetical protein JHK85_034476 [Glycine max]KAG5119340.1 hypothetical protein JHK82_033760 [Glycine max]KAG5140333.1 hypothetical protein JHK84_034101 [Glycine max]
MSNLSSVKDVMFTTHVVSAQETSESDKEEKEISGVREGFIFLLRVESPKQPQLIMILGYDGHTLHNIPYSNISEPWNRLRDEVKQLRSLVQVKDVKIKEIEIWNDGEE